jgi:glycosyltransferase involved in cell wall biosynthesis
MKSSVESSSNINLEIASSKLKILIVVPNFYTEIGSAAHIYFDLAKAFVKKGHEVDVITSYPRKYYLDNSKNDREFLMDEVIDGISIHRCKYAILRDNIFMRGLEHFIISHVFFKRYKKLGKKFDVGLIYIPPLPLYYFAKKMKRYDGTPSVLNYQDFHPQELVDVGVIKNPIMLKIMEHIEKEAYKNADYITVLTKEGINFVIRRGGDPTKIQHLYNAVDLIENEKYKSIKTFKKEEGIEDKFLITYAGILSYFQNIDQILDAAKKMKNNKDIIFYIVGDGNSKDHLIARITNESIHNVKILPLQPREKYFNIINSSDVSLISLDSRMHTPCLPGKTINLMAFKQPVIAIVPKETETARVIRESQSGLIVEPEKINNLTQAILELKNNPDIHKKFGQNGREYVEKYMNLEQNVITYERIFQKISN